MINFYFTMLAFFGVVNFYYSREYIHSHGYWMGSDTDIIDQHQFDPCLANTLSKFFLEENVQTAVDFGCGTGDYVKVLRSSNLNCEGYNGNANTYELTGGVGDIIDLSQPLDLGKCFDWVLCL